MSSELRSKNGNIGKENDFIAPQSGNNDNFETYLKVQNAHVHRCKMFYLNSASYEFPFRCSFLIWSFLLCYSPAGIPSLLRNCVNDIVLLFQFKYSILLKTVFLVSQRMFINLIQAFRICILNVVLIRFIEMDVQMQY